MHVAYEDAEAYAAWAGKALPDRGRVGARGARRPRRRDLRLGRRARGAGRAARELLARRLPLARASRATARPRRSARSRRTATASSTWPATSGSGRPTGTRTRHPRTPTKPCCVPRNPRGGDRGESYDPAQPQFRDPAQGDQGRLVPLRRQLLPALPARRPPAACASSPRLTNWISAGPRATLWRESTRLYSSPATIRRDGARARRGAGRPAARTPTGRQAGRPTAAVSSHQRRPAEALRVGDHGAGVGVEPLLEQSAVDAAEVGGQAQVAVLVELRRGRGTRRPSCRARACRSGSRARPRRGRCPPSRSPRRGGRTPTTPG